MSLIIGYGNPLRSDDALGQMLAEALGGIAVAQLNPELAENIAHADLVIFIDACYGETAGEIDYARLRPNKDAPISHYSSPSALLSAAQALYGNVPPAYLISITGASFDYGDRLSPQIKQQLPSIIEKLRALITKIQV